jgi:hypothetical protein
MLGLCREQEQRLRLTAHIDPIHDLQRVGIDQHDLPRGGSETATRCPATAIMGRVTPRSIE